MNRWSRVGQAVTGTFMLLALWTCEDDPADEGNQDISDPEVFEATAKEAFLPIIEAITDGLMRVMVALDGGALDGVVIIPTQTGADASILVDFDGNGSREGTINGSFGGDIATGAQITIGSVTGDDQSLVAGGSLTVTETSPGVLLLDNMVGSGESDPPGSGNIAEVDVTDGAVSIDAVAGVPNGFVEFDVTGESNTLSISVTFIPNQSGGFSIHITGSGGIDFTIP